MPFPDFSSTTLTAIEAAMEAAPILAKGFGTEYEIEVKPGRQNFVTEYDKASEKAIISHIKKRFPSHRFLAEESGTELSEGDGEILWIIDPLDGTTNFAHHIPIFTISIAACKGDQPLCGVIYQPMTQELFIAEAGKGAYLNDERLQVSQTKRVEDALFITSLPYEIAFSPVLSVDQLAALSQMGTVIRNFGSAALALAYVAAGKIDGFWMYNLHPWDIAAGQLLIEEAGGLFTKYSPNRSIDAPGNILASNRALHSTFQQLLHETS